MADARYYAPSFLPLSNPQGGSREGPQRLSCRRLSTRPLMVTFSSPLCPGLPPGRRLTALSGGRQDNERFGRSTARDWRRSARRDGVPQPEERGRERPEEREDHALDEVE